MNRFILRDEYFGSTVYDRKKLTFRFFNDKKTSSLKKGKLIENDFVTDTKDIEFRKGNIENAPKGLLYSPIRVYFEITKKCNLRCKNCFSYSERDFSDELSLENIMKTLDGLREDNVLEVRITGREPTQRKGWQEILNHAKNNGLAVSLNTNGVYDNNNMIDSLNELELEQIIISLDGLKETHEKMRGAGTYAKTLETIRQLSKNGRNIRINTILNNYTIEEIEQMVELASNYSAEICFILLRPVGKGLDLLDEFPSITKLNDVVKRVNVMRQKYKKTKIMTSYDVISQNAIKPAKDLDLTSCAAGLRGCNINYDGGIYACGFLAELSDDFRLGNIQNEEFSILRIWRYSSMLEDFRKRSLEKTVECKSCIDYEINCFGSCVVMEKYAELKLLGKDPYCFKDL